MNIRRVCIGLETINTSSMSLFIVTDQIAFKSTYFMQSNTFSQWSTKRLFALNMHI